ncbi:AAA family ATPase [Spirulina sp. 06S082]|uniref:AAA family ATPase n=1 Tax=Spirulina sp. 06S082 TaxID=3110248 RepID=UPI002B1F5DC5|nr:AAA family ATPase [Spirulina sp. 06S082]MEA5467965.1 AAA family ATPase [Spirulina sp. 06S082]
MFCQKKKLDKDSFIDVIINDKPITETLSVNEIREYEISKEQDIERNRKLGKFFIYDDDNDIEPILPVAYFPAFRTMIEAWTSAEYRTEYRTVHPRVYKQKIQNSTTNFSRELFGRFVPTLNYPSPIEIEIELSQEIGEALSKIERADRQYFGELLPRIFEVLSKNPHSSEQNSSLGEESSDMILEDINILVKKLEDYPITTVPNVTQLRNSVSSFQVDDKSKRIAEKVLEIYRKALREVVAVQEKSFKNIEIYLNSINSFLEEKTIEISLKEPRFRGKMLVGMKFDSGQPEEKHLSIRRALSSGERQIVTLIYAATHMSKQQVVLIDEPEISLNPIWQRHLLQTMSEQLGQRQIIVCTHSPVIGADYEDEVIMFSPKITCSSDSIINDSMLDEENEEF